MTLGVTNIIMGHVKPQSKSNHIESQIETPNINSNSNDITPYFHEEKQNDGDNNNNNNDNNKNEKSRINSISIIASAVKRHEIMTPNKVL